MIPIPNEILNDATALAMNLGIRIFQGARLAPTDKGHVAELLRYMRPPAGSLISDIGSGIGEVARLMRLQRPDIDFVLINKNARQLSHSPMEFQTILADMHDIPVWDSMFDGAMFCYSLCHGDFPIALREAARVTRFGGFLFVYDYERMHGDNVAFQQSLFARAISRLQMTQYAAEVGWRINEWHTPKADDTPFREAFDNDEGYNAIFGDLRVCVWRAMRG